jgi:chemotaxis family two-component system sensor kinase Cph1
MIIEIVRELESVNAGRKLNISIGQTPDITGEPTMISQVFSNLIGNAVKYSGYAALSEIHIEGVVKQDEICYSIQDNGIGIPEKDLPKIFDLFQRLDNVKDIEGSGVGLAIVKRIMDRHRGKIWVESVPGQGSKFHISFNKNGVKKRAEQ